MSELALDYSTRPSRGWRFHLLGDGRTNSKMAKLASELGFAPFNLSLSPHKSSGAGNVCSFASPGCSDVCNAYSGMSTRFSSVVRARIRKTKFWFEHREKFLELLTADLDKVSRTKGAKPIVRLNTFSDLPWERYLDLTNWPNIQFYDYTKIYRRLGGAPANYYLSFSLSETNERQAKQALKRGFNTVAVFWDKPEKLWGYPVIDGDKHDYRFLDPSPVVVGLKPKGAARQDKTGFVR